MEDERIEAIRSWPKPKLVQDIQVFLGFANFYHCFIWGFSKIAEPLILMLRTGSLSPSENFLNKMVEDDEVVGRSNNSGQNFAKSKKSKNCQILAKFKNSSHPKSSKKAILNKSKILVNLTIGTNTDATEYLTAKAREAFTRSKQAFTKAPIF